MMLKILYWVIFNVPVLILLQSRKICPPKKLFTFFVYIIKTYFVCNTLVVLGDMQLTLQSVNPCLLHMAIENRP